MAGNAASKDSALPDAEIRNESRRDSITQPRLAESARPGRVTGGKIRSTLIETSAKSGFGKSCEEESEYFFEKDAVRAGLVLGAPTFAGLNQSWQPLMQPFH
jgi:hypothetical protein